MDDGVPGMKAMARNNGAPTDNLERSNGKGPVNTRTTSILAPLQAHQWSAVIWNCI